MNNYKQQQKKQYSSSSSSSSSSSGGFSLFGMFKSKKSRSSSNYGSKYSAAADEYVKAYKVYPSDEDRGRWVAEPGIDKKASAYISLTTDRWEKLTT